MKAKGNLEQFEKNKVFHSQHFEHRLYMLKSGFVKRYQVTNKEKVIELIYGPANIFPLSQLYERIFNLKQNQENFIYVYQTMTDVEVYSLSESVVLSELKNDPQLYIDLYYESGLRLKSNINHLASNSFHDNYKKVAHQLYSLAQEFGSKNSSIKSGVVKIEVPLEPIDIAEQLNISKSVVSAALKSLTSHKLITYESNIISIKDIEMLKDIFL